MCDDVRILIEGLSPSGSLAAVVEDDGRTVTLHLGPSGGGSPAAGHFDPRSLWVCNRVPAPPSGDGPTEAGDLVPAGSCDHPAGLPAPDPERLSLVWFPAGDAVALLEDERVQAVIPPWAGAGRCPGYSARCTAKSPLAWPISGEPVLLDRVARARDERDVWERGDPWPGIRRTLLCGLESVFGPHTRYFSIDGGRWPPRFLARFDPTSGASPPAVVLATGGMSCRPQPRMEELFQDPARRVELVLALCRELYGDGCPELHGALSRAAASPWRRMTWLSDGLTLPIGGIPAGASGTRFDACLVTGQPPSAPDLRLPDVLSEPVSPLWLVPITAGERRLAMDKGGRALESLLQHGGCGFVHRDRVSLA